MTAFELQLQQRLHDLQRLEYWLSSPLQKECWLLVSVFYSSNVTWQWTFSLQSSVITDNIIMPNLATHNFLCTFLIRRINLRSGIAGSKGMCISFFFFFNIYLALQGLSCGTKDFPSIFSCSTQTLSCGMWDLVPWSGIEPRPPALGRWSLSHWTTREIPSMCISDCDRNCQTISKIIGGSLYACSHQ